MKNLYAKSAPEWTPLNIHLKQVALASIKFADYLDLDTTVAYNGAILHDLGKGHPYFQRRLQGQDNNTRIFRHEISSLFFLSIFPEDQWDSLIEMVVAHHKSVDEEVGGLLYLDEHDDYLNFHLGEWDNWSLEVLKELKELGFSNKIISKEQALENFQYALNYTQNASKTRDYSIWRGLLMGADHFASSQIDKTEEKLSHIFKAPNLDFFNRQHTLYPLSFVNVDSEHQHTIVVASTGAGKTDYLLRRCKGRIFYTLPFQASINAMYKRIGADLEPNNPNIDIRVQHSSSIVVKRNEQDDTSLQNLIGASIKILTPHQLATIAFGLKGFESIILDIKNCDIILDEVHTYSGVSQALVLKLVEILKKIGCRVHIGTATMPTVLYQKIKEILGEDVLEVKLSDEELMKFNRHIIYKLPKWDNSWSIINNAIEQKQKILIVFNKVDKARDFYSQIQELYSNTPSMLLHSRFKRGDRNEKERNLIGVDNNGNSLDMFNTSSEACIVVSTQIVEVSLDISFDLMITETAPLDALIQRFGRVNRKRTAETIGKYKDVYVVAPLDNEKDVKPYDLQTIQRSFEMLENGVLLDEREIQDKMDIVFSEINFMNIEEHAVFKNDGRFTQDKLTHNSKSILFDLLDIDSVVCITEGDQEEYENTTNIETRLLLEIPTYYYAVSKMEQSKKGNKPFIIPDAAYNNEAGLDLNKIKEENFNVLNRFL